jgi:type II secretory pathway pseudopilin PulG
MSNRQSAGTTGIAVIAVLVVRGGAGAFVYKAMLLDSRVPAGASASPAESRSPSPSASPSSPAASDTPAVDAPNSGGAASGIGRALSGLRKVVTGEARQSQEEAARLSSLLSTLYTLRSQIALYRLQHNDNWPNFRTYPGSDQLTRQTYEDGTLAERGEDEAEDRPRQRYGPYIQSMPPNPLNGAAEVATVDEDVKDGDTITPPDGFDKAGYVFCTSSGRISATDATGRRVADPDAIIARQNMSTPAGRQEVFVTTLGTLRSQVQLYRLQHQDTIPDFRRYPQWEQLLKKTDADGSISPRGQFGPYVVKLPVNPHNGFSAAEVVDTDPPAGFKAKGANVGWVVNSDSGILWGTDAKGVVIQR